MGVRRKSIKLLEHEKSFLQQAYKRRRITTDDYKVRKADLHDLAEEFRRQFGRTDSDEDIFHYMFVQRKRGLWVTLDGNQEPKTKLPSLPAEHVEVLVDIYRDHLVTLGTGSDAFAFDADICFALEKEFEDRTMRRIPGAELMAILTDLRKRGLLPKAADNPVQKPEEHQDDSEERRG